MPWKDFDELLNTEEKPMADNGKTQMPSLSHIGIERYMCDILEEMRSTTKTLNFGGLLGMIEEAQVTANRMEASLTMEKNVQSLSEDIHLLKKARKALTKEVRALIDKRDGLEKK